MMKAIALIKRKPGLSHAEFRTHYESNHAPLALTFIGPFLTDYRRSYPTEAFSYAEAVDADGGASESGFGYDCITELWFENRDMMDRMLAVLAEPAVRDVLQEDEERFLDRTSVVFIPCEEIASAL